MTFENSFTRDELVEMLDDLAPSISTGMVRELIRAKPRKGVNMLGLPSEELYRYGSWAGNPKGQKEDTTCCRYEVWPNTRGAIPYQCNRKRGHGYKGWFCAQHAKFYPVDYKQKEGV